MVSVDGCVVGTLLGQAPVPTSNSDGSSSQDSHRGCMNVQLQLSGSEVQWGGKRPLWGKLLVALVRSKKSKKKELLGA